MFITYILADLVTFADQNISSDAAILIVLMIFLIIALVISLICVSKKLSKIGEENDYLKEKIQKLYKDNGLINQNVKEVIVKNNNQLNENGAVRKNQNIAQTTNSGQAVNKKIYSSQARSTSKTKEKTKQKNGLILSIGAICIVLSAIVFLMSTWNSIPNLLKTSVLVLLTAVFFGSSYIAKSKFKLDDASKVFFYIAMAYIPICLVSISIFSLLGKYLSIYGDGRFIYFAISSAIVAVIYYCSFNKNKNMVLFSGSVLSQCLSVIMFTLIFSNSIVLIIIDLLIYNLLFIILTKNKKIEIVYCIIPIISIIALIFQVSLKDINLIFMISVLVINCLVLQIKFKRVVYSYIFNILLVILGAYSLNKYQDLFGKDLFYIFLLIYIICMYSIESLILHYKVKGEFKDSLLIVTLSSLTIMNITMFVFKTLMKPYVVSIVILVILQVAYYTKNKTWKQVISILLPLCFIAMCISIIISYNLNYHSYIILALLMVVITELVKKKELVLYKNSFIISQIYLIVTYIVMMLFNYINFIDDFIYAILLLLVYLYMFKFNKIKMYKYFTYILSNYVIFSVLKFFFDDTKILFYIPLFTTSMIMLLEKLKKDLNDEWVNIYLIISQVISFICMYFINDNISIIISFIYFISILAYNQFNKNHYFNIAPLVMIIPNLVFLDQQIGIKYALCLSSILIILILALFKKNISIFTLFSGIYLIVFYICSKGIYTKEVLFIIWSALNSFSIENEKFKDIFKFLSYIAMTILFNTIINKTGMDSYTAVSMLGYVILSIVLLRTILNKYIKDSYILEYIIFSSIYLVAITMYKSELDAMLFVLFIVLIMIFSYCKKYSEMFIISGFAILANILLLTRKFWFSIPWWVYLLVIGTILILFGIRNEVVEKDKKIRLLKLITNIKDRIEKR